jgi:hypothetical protein
LPEEVTDPRSPPPRGELAPTLTSAVPKMKVCPTLSVPSGPGRGLPTISDGPEQVLSTLWSPGVMVGFGAAVIEIF